MNAKNELNTTTCPECGASLAAGEKTCWLCRRALEQAQGQPGQRPGARKRAAAPFEGDSLVWAVLGVLALLVCVGLMLEQPGVGILLAIVATPALVRTAVVEMRQREQGKPMTAGHRILAFVSSIGVVATVGVAAVVTFYVTCLAVCFGGSAMLGINERNAADAGIFASIAAGVVVALALAIFLLWKSWPRKNQL
jgi:hypothetical protein